MPRVTYVVPGSAGGGEGGAPGLTGESGQPNVTAWGSGCLTFDMPRFDGHLPSRTDIAMFGCGLAMFLLIAIILATRHLSLRMDRMESEWNKARPPPAPEPPSPLLDQEVIDATVLLARDRVERGDTCVGDEVLVHLADELDEFKESANDDA